MDLAESRGAVPAAGGTVAGRVSRATAPPASGAAVAELGPARCRYGPGAWAAHGSEPQPIPSPAAPRGARRALEPSPPLRPRAPRCPAPAARVLQGKPEEEEDRVTAGMIKRLREMCSAV